MPPYTGYSNHTAPPSIPFTFAGIPDDIGAFFSAFFSIFEPILIFIIDAVLIIGISLVPILYVFSIIFGIASMCMGVNHKQRPAEEEDDTKAVDENLELKGEADGADGEDGDGNGDEDKPLVYVQELGRL